MEPDDGARWSQMEPGKVPGKRCTPIPHYEISHNIGDPMPAQHYFAHAEFHHMKFHHMKCNNACHMVMHMPTSHNVAMRVPCVSE